MGAIFLPGLWCPAHTVNASSTSKTIVAVNGFDGSMMNSFYEVGAPSAIRGFNVLIFDGPGQGSASRYNRALFRVDWEVPVSAALKWLYAHAGSGVDPRRVVLWGRSFGGYLAPRAFVKLDGSAFAALVADGGVLDMFQNVVCTLSPQLQQLLASNPAQFDQYVMPALNVSLSLLNNYRWAQLGLNSSSMSSFILAFQPYTLTDDLSGVVSRPVLVNNPAWDTATFNQSSLFWAAMQNESRPLNAASLLLQQDPLRGTGLHCDVGSTANTVGTIIRWAEVNV